MTRIMLSEDDFEQLVNGETVVKDNVHIALSDIGMVVMRKHIDNLEQKMILRRRLERLSREEIVQLLEGASIQSYDSESTVELREALIENIIDGTIDEEAVEEFE